MRILLVSDGYPPDPGGLEAHVARLARHLRGRGHLVKVLAASMSGREAKEATGDDDVVRADVSLARVPGSYQTGAAFHPPWPDPAFRRRALRVVADFAPDVVHAHGWSVFSAASLAGTTPVVTTLHDHGMACPKKTLLRHDRVCERGRGPRCVTCNADTQPGPRRVALAAALGATVPWLVRRVSRFLAVSHFVAQSAAGSGVPRRLLEVVPNFIDIDNGHPAAPAQPPDGVRFFFAGTGSPHKGRQVLLEAFDRLDSRADVSLTVAGDVVPMETNSPRIDDVGRLEGPTLDDAYRKASAVIVPSVWPEPCPTVALEAMAYGRPVIASAIGGLTDIVADGQSGLLVRPGDARALSDALARLADEPEERRAMGAEARRRVRAFSASAVVPRIEEIYSEVAGGT